nr:uncharacterized protein LOC131789670 [Pocillopora verrucosa]
MALQPFTNEQLNYFKFAFLVLNEFPKALRQTFKQMWNNTVASRPGFQPWDDSNAVRNLFLSTEGGASKVPTHLSYDEWDCTVLFQATIYARSFALPDSKGHHRILHDLYLRSCKLPRGTFHSSVVSSTGDDAETFALAVDQLRLLRNSLFHLNKSELDKIKYDRYVQLAKDSIKALGVNTDPIDAVGGLTESDFPTEKVRKLEDDVKKELQKKNEFLEEEVIDDLQLLQKSQKEGTEELKNAIESESHKDDTESLKEAIAASEERMVKKINEFSQEMKDLLREPQSLGFKPRFSRLNLPSHFTGREKECEEIIDHLTSDSTQIVSVWGSPGFGKTSTAIAVGHQLQKVGLPVCSISLRGLNSKVDLTSKLLSHFRTAESKNQSLTAADEIGFIFERLSDPCLLILDNADDLFECGEPDVKEKTVNLIKDLLNRSEKVKFLLTTREPMAYLDMSLQGHKSTRIGELDKLSSIALVKKLLPHASSSDAIKIVHMCGQVPLAIWLLCKLLSDDSAQCSAALDELMLSKSSLLESLDNPEYTSDARLKTLFESSFLRLSSRDQEALVSLSVLPETFDLEIATAVLGLERSTETKEVLRRLQGRALIDRCSNSDKFSIHKLLQSFAKDKGEREMGETILIANTRFLLFYIDLAEKLNEMFLTGHSMKALIEFFDNERSIVKSLMDGCTNNEVADRVFQVLAKAEFFLDTAYWDDEPNFDKIYQTAIEAASQLGRSVLHRQLLQSKAFGYMTWGGVGKTMLLLSEARRLQSLTTTSCPEERGKHLCYSGIYQLVVGKTDDGVESLEGAISLLNKTAELKVLRLMILQILAIFYGCTKGDYELSAMFYDRAVQECKEAEDMHLLVIPDNNGEANYRDEHRVPSSTENLGNEPIEIGVIYLVVSAIKKICSTEITDFSIKLLLRILQGIDSTNEMTKPGWFRFQAIAITMLSTFHRYQEGLSLTQKLITYYLNSLQKGTTGEENFTSSLQKEALAEWYLLQGKNQHCLRHFSEAFTSKQHALTIILELFGEKHIKTADVYSELGFTKHELGDYNSAAESYRLALDIRIQLLGEKHRRIADSYNDLGITEHALRDYTSAAKSHKRALNIRQKKRALNIRQKVLGEDHEKTADSYFYLGNTQYVLKDYTSATESHKRALNIRQKVLGEDHENTADSYNQLGVTQYVLKDYTSATESHKRALNIRQKVLGEDHEKTAHSYNELGITQYVLKDYTSATESFKRALNIRQKVLGEDHEKTAHSYCNLGVTQYMLKDYTSATESHKRALNIRQKVLGEDHEKTAHSYH